MRRAVATALVVAVCGVGVTLAASLARADHVRALATVDARAWLGQAGLQLDQHVAGEALRLGSAWTVDDLTAPSAGPWWHGVRHIADRGTGGHWRAVFFLAAPGRGGGDWFTLRFSGRDQGRTAHVARIAIWESTPLLAARSLPQELGRTLMDARDSGEARLSPALGAGGAHRSAPTPGVGLALVVPVYTGVHRLGPPPSEERRTRLAGWLVADLVLDDLLDDMMRSAPESAMVAVLDDQGRTMAQQWAPPPGEALHAADDLADADADPANGQDPGDAHGGSEVVRAVAATGSGHGLLRVTSSADLTGSPISILAVVKAPTGAVSWPILLTGLVTTALVIVLFVGRIRAEQRARRMVVERTRELSRRTGELELVTGSTPDLMVRLDAAGRVLFANPAIQHELGLRETSIGEGLSETGVPEAFASAVLEVIGAVRAGAAEERFDLQLGDGDARRDLEVYIVPAQHDDIDTSGDVLVVARDVTQRRATERILAERALHDPLTGLANRALVEDHLTSALRRRDHRCVALLLMDLDHFKLVNDSLGHAVGDDLLVQLAARLQQNARCEDTVGRLGGDEFVVVAVIDDPTEAELLGHRVLTVLSSPFDLLGTAFTFTASLGVALAHPGEAEGPELLAQADAAMYRAKGTGGNALAVYEPTLAESALDRLVRAEELRVALAEEQLYLEYQPQIDLRTMRPIGVEALARWRHPTLGAQSPGAFVHIAEETGLIVELGRWVTEQVIIEAAAREDRLDGEPFRFWVNVSARQFALSDPAATVLELLEEHGVDGRRLGIEITESTLGQDTDRVEQVLDELRAAGVGVAVDDFGTGWSSLARLQFLPVDVLKIDKAFVGALSSGPYGRSEHIVRGIIAMGRALSAEIVAEGIETEEQLATLRGLGCDTGQGYLFSRPVTIDLAVGTRFVRAGG